MNKGLLSVFSINIFFWSLSWSAVHHPQVFLKTVHGSASEGALIANHYCISCHAVHPLISIGAPRIGIVADWNGRIHQGSESLWQHLNEGWNAMPARGGCFECTDTQLWLALKFLLPERFKKSINKPH